MVEYYTTTSAYPRPTYTESVTASGSTFSIDGYGNSYFETFSNSSFSSENGYATVSSLGGTFKKTIIEPLNGVTRYTISNNSETHSYVSFGNSSSGTSVTQEESATNTAIPSSSSFYYTTGSTYETTTERTSSFAVGSMVKTFTNTNTYATTGNSTISNTQTLTVYVNKTSTSLSTYSQTYADITTSTASRSTFTGIDASTTLTTSVMVPFITLASIYERGTDERLFTLKSDYKSTTVAISQALTEVNKFTYAPTLVTTNSTDGTTYSSSSYLINSQIFYGSFTRNTGSTSVTPTFFEVTQSAPGYTVNGPYPITTPYFGGYNVGVTSITYGRGPFSFIVQNLPGGPIGTVSYNALFSYTDTITNQNVRVFPLSSLSFSGKVSTTADSNVSGLGVFTYKTTSLAYL